MTPQMKPTPTPTPNLTMKMKKKKKKKKQQSKNYVVAVSDSPPQKAAYTVPAL
jgi:hypothetical protein